MGRYGILPRQEILTLIENKGIIAPPLDDKQVQAELLELRLGEKVVCLNSNISPSLTIPIEDMIKKHFVYDFKLSDGQTKELMRDQNYLIELQEEANLPPGFFAETDGKSTTARVDLLTRVIGEKESRYNTVTPGSKKLWVLCNPGQFNILLKKGMSLNQMYISYGNPDVCAVDEAELKTIYNNKPLLYNPDGTPIPIDKVTFRDGGIEVTADLESEIVAYMAKRNSGLKLNLGLSRSALFERKDEFWESVKAPKDGEISLEEDEFYLLGTYERVHVPNYLCGSLSSHDPNTGEGRLHGARGFGPGWFGPATLEIRYSETRPVRHRESKGVMRYLRLKNIPLNEKGEPTSYGSADFKSNYQGQARGPNLPKMFLPPLENKP